MPNFDLRTVILLIGVMGLLMSAIIFFLRRSLPSTIEGLGEWAAAPAIILISMVLLAARGAIPDFFSIVCGNLLLLAGCVFFYVGAQRFFGMAAKQRLWHWLFALTLAALAIAWCTLIEPNYAVRLRLMAALMFGIFISLALLVHRHGGVNFSGRFVTGVLLVQSTVILLRFFATFVWTSGNGLFEPFVYQTLYIASFAFTMLLLTVGTVLLANDRMRVEFENIIGARQRSEEALRESEERWKFAIEGSGDGVWDWNLQTGDATFSKRWKEMLGWAESEIGNSSEEWVKRVCPEDLPGVMANIQEHLDQKTAAAAVEYRLLTKAGSWKWILGRGIVVSRDAAGKPLRLVGTNTDITERKQSEEARRASDEQMRAFYELNLVGLAITSPEKGWVRVNHCLCQMLEYSEDELRALTWAQLTYPDDLAADLEQFNRLLAKEIDGYTLEKRFISRTGRIVPTQLVVRCTCKADGAIDFVIAMIEDITERKQAEADRARFEAQLRESQKMEALGTMAGGVAHDFNNALTMITGNAELARQDVGPGHPALVSLEEIDKASRRAKDLVQQILAFSRRQKLERKATSLALVVVESARLIRATLPMGVRLNVECKADTPAVLADATQIKQILLNLCGNAAQALQDQGRPGTIEVSLSAYDHASGEAQSNLPSGRYACLSVRDDGPGMDEATRLRIFEPFFTTKPVGKGTGLGLAVVHGIAQAHEASIEVKTAPGEGSQFRIYFPAIAAPVAEDAPPAQEAAPVHGAGKHVLYVDDEEAIIFLMTRLLQRQGFRVSGYTDPREALGAVKANPDQFDLAVTDYNMPGMSGLAVASALRQIRADLPVVLASGYITEDLRQKAPAAGVRELIYKPNTVDELCEAVARYANAQNEIAP